MTTEAEGLFCGHNICLTTGIDITIKPVLIQTGNIYIENTYKYIDIHMHIDGYLIFM